MTRLENTTDLLTTENGAPKELNVWVTPAIPTPQQDVRLVFK